MADEYLQAAITLHTLNYILTYIKPEEKSQQISLLYATQTY